jgi:hypothetical protein
VKNGNAHPENAMPPELIAEAKRRAGLWVYGNIGSFGTHDAVPPEAIKGAWKVADQGEIVSDFIPILDSGKPDRS